MGTIDKKERLHALWQLLQTTHEQAPLTAAHLASALSVSERTIRYDLDALTAYAKERGKRLERRARRGIWLASSAQCTRMQPSIGDATTTRTLSPKERRDTLLYHLITDEVQTIDALAERVDVSRTTLLADLKSVQDFLEQRGLRYHSKRGQGIWIAGEELSIRDALIHIFARPLYDFRRFSQVGTAEGQSGCLFRLYVDALDTEHIAKTFFSIAAKHGLTGSDAGLNRMLVTLCVFLLRIRQGHRIDTLPTKGKTTELPIPSLQRVAQMLALSLEDEIQTNLPKGEVDALFAEILHSRLHLLTDRAHTATQAIDLAKVFVADAEIWLGDVYQDDAELLHALALHLQPAIDRARFGIAFTNPLLPDIQDAYRDLFQIAERAASRMEERTGIAFSPDEIGYLTIHLGAARERKRKMRHAKLSVLLVCGNGQGTANLLAMTLEKHLDYLSITRKVSFYELNETATNGIDLILTTVPLAHDTLPVLQVSPIMREAELKVIESQIAYCLGKKVEHRQGQAVSDTGCRLVELLTDDVIALDVEIGTWQAAIRCAGDLLEQAGAVTPTYTTRMIEVIDRLGPYMTTTDGVLMPHAGIHDGAKRVAVCLVRLAHPIHIGTAHEKIDLLFAFSAIDETSHLHLIRDLWTLFQDEVRLMAIRRAKSKEEMREIIGGIGKTANHT